MRDGLARLREIWQNTTRTNQTMAVAAALAAIIACIGFVYWAATPEYVPLVSGASASDSAAILSQLKDKKVLYRISADGGTIEVPAAQRAELRMSLAAAGLLNTGSLGYGMLRDINISTPQAIADETIRRSFEGDLENSIQSLQQVSAAHVKIAAGRDSPFLSEKKDASASVLVHLKPGQELSKENVRSIVNMVAHAYSGLDPKHISMMDGMGNQLWDGEQQSAATVGAEERQAQEQAYKNSLGREIQAKLNAVLGPGMSSVSVRCTLNLNKENVVKKEVLPGAPRQKSVTSEKLTGPGALRGGGSPVGVASNTGGATTGAAAPPTYAGAGVSTSGEGNYTGEKSDQTYDNGTSETQTARAPGTIESLAVAVLVDKSVSAETVAVIKKDIETFAEVDPANPKRRVSVQTMSFNRAAEAAEKNAADSAASAERINRILGYAVPLGLMLLMLFILARSLRRAAPQQQLALPGGGQIIVEPDGTSTVIRADGRRVPIGAGGSLDLTIGEDIPPGMSVEEALAGGAKVLAVSADEQVHTFEVISEAFDANLESITHLAKSKPDTVALLIKSWISEEKK